MNKIILGIDGGGTKTLGVAWNSKGNEVNRFETGFSNFAVDVDITKKHIEQTLDFFKKYYKKNVYVLIGVSGISALSDLNIYERYLQSKYYKNLKLVSDGLLALYSIKGKSSKIMAIGGTGSIVYAIDKNNKIIRLGGHGHILGDEGSAYNLVIETFKYVINYYDRNDNFDEFSKELINILNIKTIEELKTLVYSLSKREIAGYALIINDLAEKGSEKAQDLLFNEGSKLGGLIVDTYKKSGIDDDVIIALRGSFTSKSQFVKKGLINYLNENKIKYNLEEKEQEPIQGALNFYNNKKE